jgi:2-methylcitrate dehydratase PrpD
MRGTPQCSVWGHRFKTSLAVVAFANGVAGQVRDYAVMRHPATHVILIDADISMATFTDEQGRRPSIVAWLANSHLPLDPTIPANFDEMWTSVSVQMRDGKEDSVHCDRPRGIWGNPLNPEERLARVRQCPARVLSDAHIERLIAIVEDLVHASSTDVLALVGLLAQSPASLEEGGVP